MKVKHVMTRDPSCCLPSDPAPKAAMIMRNENAGSVPVVEDTEGRKVVGIVTDRDLCMGIVAENREPGGVTVGECMTATVVTCSANDAVAKVTELMKENQIRRVPVVDDTGALLGIVSMADLVSRGEVKSTEAHDTLKQVSQPSPEPSKPRAKDRDAA
jgi:CBS domain-containing protein